MQGITTVRKQGESDAPSASIGLVSANAFGTPAAKLTGVCAPGGIGPSHFAGGRRGRSFTALESFRSRLFGRRGRVVADALARERRRIAADVHDLVMQDLAFALATARVLADEPVRTPQASAVVAAGERALAGARHVVGGLVAHDRTPVAQAVGSGVRAAARSTPLSFDASAIPEGAQPDQPTLEALVHIGREAVTNAVKHASPGAIEVTLERADEWRLRVRDDGHGFDAPAAGRGFGLASMSRHAEALGGSLRVIGAPGAGTTVEAMLP